MQNSALARILVCACLLGSATAAPITWQAAAPTNDPTAVVTDGDLVEAINGSETSGIVTVNGVDFSPQRDILPNGAADRLLSGEQTLDPGLDALLDTLSFGGGTSTSITVGGGSLVPGQGYIIQVFLTDLRGSSTRGISFGDGDGNSVFLSARSEAGSFGQNATGSFVADGTDQTLSLVATSYSNAHITAYQIRRTTSLPAH